MRIHIGNIGPQLAEHIDDLKSRLVKYGEVQGELELRKKPMLDTFFLFVDMDLDQEKFNALRRALNDVKFRQSSITIQEARPKWEWNPQDDEPLQPNPDQLKRLKSHLNLVGLYKGKMREIPRSSAEKPTFRVKYPSGCVRKIRGRMQRLWGYEKKLPQNLVYEYVDGEWKDLTGRPVELAVRDEQSRDNRLARDVSGGGFLSDSDLEDFKQQVDEDAYNGEYEDEKMEIVGNEQSRNSRMTTHDDSDTDEEFYANPPRPQHAEKEEGVFVCEAQSEVDENSVNTTEALRDVLAAPTSFTLFGGDDVEPQDTEHEAITAPEPVAPAAKKFGLFFSHSESPFLQTQAQLLKLKRGFDPTEWDKTFWENRGEWNRQLRRRRREDQRLSRKRGAYTRRAD